MEGRMLNTLKKTFIAELINRELHQLNHASSRTIMYRLPIITYCSITSEMETTKILVWSSCLLNMKPKSTLITLSPFIGTIYALDILVRRKISKEENNLMDNLEDT